MEPDFEKFLKKISGNNDMTMNSAEAFQRHVDKTTEANASRSGTQNTS